MLSIKKKEGVSSKKVVAAVATVGVVGWWFVEFVWIICMSCN
jgi:hypothetical protein